MKRFFLLLFFAFCFCNVKADLVDVTKAELLVQLNSGEDLYLENLKYVSIFLKTPETLINFRSVLKQELDKINLFLDYWYLHLKNPTRQDKLEKIVLNNKDEFEEKIKKLEYLKLRNSSYLGFVEELRSTFSIGKNSGISFAKDNVSNYREVLDKFIFCMHSFFNQDFYPGLTSYDKSYELFVKKSIDEKYHFFIEGLNNFLNFKAFSKNEFAGLKKQNILRRNWLKYSFWTVILGTGTYLVFKNKDAIKDYVIDKVDSISNLELFKYRNYLNEQLYQGVGALVRKGFVPDEELEDGPSLGYLLNLKDKVLANDGTLGGGDVEVIQPGGFLGMIGRGFGRVANGATDGAVEGISNFAKNIPDIVQVHYLILYRNLLDVLDVFAFSFNFVKIPLLVIASGFIFKNVLGHFMSNGEQKLEMILADLYKLFLKYGENKDFYFDSFSYNDKGLFIYLIEKLESKLKNISGEKKIVLLKLVDLLKDESKTVYEKIKNLKLEYDSIILNVSTLVCSSELAGV